MLYFEELKIRPIHSFMSMYPKVSVIIPVYNVASYIADCLDSVKNQTFKDYELIIVNDGSTDNSLSVIENHAHNFSDIKIITQNNQGLSAARNNGVSAAMGDFIFFLDSDDYILPSTLELLYKACIDNDTDLAICGVNMFWENGKTRKHLYPVHKSVIPSIEFCTLMLSGKAFSWAWTKLYRRSLWLKHKLEFPVGKTFEDIAISFSILEVYNRIAIVNQPLYQYRIHQASITGTVSIKKIHDFITQTQQALFTANNILADSSLGNKTERYIEAYITIQSTQLMAMYSAANYHNSNYKKIIGKQIGLPSIASVASNPNLGLRNKVRCVYYRLLKSQI